MKQRGSLVPRAKIKLTVLAVAIYLVAVSLLLSIHVAQAQSVTVDFYSETNQDEEMRIDAVHPSASSAISAIGSSFTCSQNAYLINVTFYLRKAGSPTGTAKAYLYTHSGTYGTSSLPTGSSLAASDSIDLSTIAAGYALYNFTFSADQQYAMTSNYYVFAFQIESGSSVDGSNCIYAGVDASSPAHDGNCIYFQNSAWTADSLSDIPFYVYGEPYTPATPATAIAEPYIYAATSLMSLSLVIGVGAAMIVGLQDQNMEGMLPVIITGVAITIILWIVLPLMNAFSGL